MPPETKIDNAHDLWPIFVLSLADQKQRRDAIEKQLNELNLEFEFIDSVDGRKGLPIEFEKKIDRKNSIRPMADAEYACSLTHLKACERVISDNLPGAIILEDDALLKLGFREFLDCRDYMAAELILFDYINAFRWRWERGHKFTSSGYGFRVMNKPLLATGYSISRKGAENFLKVALPVRSPSDWPINFQKFDHLLLSPRTVISSDPHGIDSAAEKARRGLIVSWKQKKLTEASWSRFWDSFHKKIIRRLLAKKII